MKTILSLIFLVAHGASAASPIEVQGHRGTRGMRPENTLPAFGFALAAGVDTLELDIAVTRDGELLISHDPAITPELCLDADGRPLKEAVKIHTLTLSQAQKYDCGSLRNPRFPTQVPVPHTPKPTLAQLFEMVEHSKLPGAKTVQFNIETKIYPAHPELTPTPEEFARKIIELARRHGMVARSTLQSFDDRTLLAAKKLEPALRTVLLTSDNHLDYVAAVKAAHADILSPDQEWILPEDIAAAHRAGIRVIPWTVNETSGWQRMLDLGVDGIISDQPAALIAFLKSKGLRK